MIDTPPPRPWATGWQQWPAVLKAHQLAAKGLFASLGDPPAAWAGRGAIVCGGGAYWVSAYVTVRMLQASGWDDPVEVWHLPGEQDATWGMRFAALGVRLVDAGEVRASHPWRILNGFELKLFAATASRFKQVLILDADSYPVADVRPLFEREDFRDAGGMFFPDLPETNKWTRWPFWAVEPFGKSCGWETGQWLLDKQTAYGPLMLAGWYDQHSDWCYSPRPGREGGDYGDKGPHRVAWAQLRRLPVMFRDRPKWAGLSFVHEDDAGNPLFVHRCRNKFAMEPNSFRTTPQNKGGPVRSNLPNEDMAWQFFEEIQSHTS